MSKVKMLTQDNCPKCVALKSFLEMGLRNKYAEDIEIVKREDNPKAFMELVEKHDLMATPVLIAGDDVLLDTTPSKVSVFLERNI
ncbi:glutaredoxin [Erysipelothrix sp. HDW6C]|uniref:glutaredoxin family protein n=1 Tax=Erysipelothrix sp. HDW6C TaxID=2714930 RepID=UPI00140DF3A1|nr:glutaredoxin [Erysipelothrix sp. HDW6C]QIK69701.1 glutaredoxin [Erysipelothrix sp. HDW6C]